MENFLSVAGLDDEDQLWSSVQAQIDAGHIRLLFVADQLSPTLVRVIEFLNRQLRSAEVLNVEVVRHAATLVKTSSIYHPAVVRGRSSSQAQGKAPTLRRTRAEFDKLLLAHHDQKVLDRVNALVWSGRRRSGPSSRWA